ncbi:MAG: histidine kinase N-terminal domain-containing protein [Actinomycetota bacterium]|nr:MAG: two-component histidine [Actinomycetota bacterium]MDP3629616.1 histidine kinase N-terminal domain-containing protein [Actinomycetota bacterium]
MDTPFRLPKGMPGPAAAHLSNVADNLQLVADLGYGDVALAIMNGDKLTVVADARPMTAVAAVASSRIGHTLARKDEPEAYDAFAGGAAVVGVRRRTTRGISYLTSARPVGPAGAPYAVLIRDLTQQVVEAPGKMEVAFMALADRVLEVLEREPIIDIDSDAPFETNRRAGDGVMEVDATDVVTYASPNAVNIMRLAGVEGGVIGRGVTTLPGGSTAITPVVRSGGARAITIEAAGRALLYRSIGFKPGALVLVEDITEAVRREQELRVKEATIREVHHRVKNNLQTIASLLRIQARRTGSDEAARALAEAVERVSSMAVVHEMLAASTEETVDFAEAARTVVDMVRQSLAHSGTDVTVTVEGETGLVPASVATSLALVCAELVHNAIEHGIGERPVGVVAVSMRRLPGEIHFVVRDDGAGLPGGFDVDSSANLGLAIVKTVVGDDLRGTLSFSSARGTTVTIRVPVPDLPGEAE